MWGIIGTWCMAEEGIKKASQMLENKDLASDATEAAIKEVEDYPYFKSVGYGGLPNEEMVVELDAGFMNGDNLDFGAVCGLSDFANPISIAKQLSLLQVNNVLVGEGANAYAHREGFQRKNMLTDRAKIHYHNRVKTLAKDRELMPYDGHDTVGMVALDQHGSMVSGTSTSGLFMKKKGRVGDSPIIGSGLYVDSLIGGASATGLGEDIMKGIMSYEIVMRIKAGMHPQKACETAVFDFDAYLRSKKGSAGDISVVAMDKQRRWGVASNMDNFSFVVATDECPATVYTTRREGDKMIHEKASKEWIDQYYRHRTAVLEEL
ncbi:N(4)-(beta-N-acetylglucosaminyl)-L-asparaginase [Facklamia sp. DSM 111018]|uniref:N(4)-(Beta-N-acetylglucosaminyl)-L-asparaginase n=1 Tax=Facklamia lactis TaxID=2749967 RepID=A0ABS0LT34_9LACT|nr:N(4)-(beta-N-acetylglucosaminyl)-L-asparaginase [Facklamia lactis]MBG9987322.1 N(4)-(beta-N-acetylglucosaminyl)-L-asparaginase [Facklamia lactis]